MAHIQNLLCGIIETTKASIASQHFLIARLVVLLTASAVISCSSANTSEKKGSSGTTGSAPSGQNQKETGKLSKSGNGEPADEDEDQDEDDDNSAGNQTKPKTKPPGGTNAGLTGESYFSTTLEPLFRSSCKQCHADPKQVAGVAAPLTIFSYTAMNTMIAKGTAADANPLIDKIQGRPNHPGGDRCKGSIENSPCKEVVQWWNVIKGNSAPGGTTGGTGKIGRVIEVTPGGRVYGWAVNPKVPEEQVKIKVYVGGAKGQGADAGTFDAFVNGNDDNTPGNHAFIADLPDMYRNGKPNTLVVYAIIENEEKNYKH